MECTATILRYIYSMQFMWLMATLIIQPASPFGADVVCENHPTFSMTKVQVEMCKNYSQLLPALFEDVFKTFKKQLHHHFKHEKWNGSNIIPPIFGEKPDDFLRKLSKESAFVYALASATVVHTVADRCMKDSLPFCECDQNLKNEDLPEDEIWTGCSPDMEFAFEFTKKFLDRRVHNYTIKDKHFVLHNNKIGRSIVKNYMHKVCTCVGIGGVPKSCSKHKSCKMELPKMQEIGDRLIKRYYTSVHSKLKSQSGHLDETKIIDRKNGQTVKPDQMIHFDSSPDYCEPAPLYNIEGVAGRECTKNASKASDQFHCDNLCCGHGSKSYIVEELKPCKCKFVWCCQVECETCFKNVTTHRCK